MMRSLLFATCFVGNQSHVVRFKRYLDYYLPRLDSLGCSRIILIDDGSDLSLLSQLNLPVFDSNDLPGVLEYDACIVRFPDNLGRPVLTVIPGWWRSFSFASVFAIRYNLDKLVHIESDTFVLSDNLFAWLKADYPVWRSLYTKRYWYAETAIQVLPRKSIGLLYEFWKLGPEYWFKNSLANIQYIPELVLPIEYVEKTMFIGDRWGEDWFPSLIPDNADYTANMGACSVGASLYTAHHQEKMDDFFSRLGLDISKYS